MKRPTVILLTVMVAIMSAVQAMANAASTKTTVAWDSPYKGAGSPAVSSASGKKFQIAPIKTSATGANTSYLNAPYHVKAKGGR